MLEHYGVRTRITRRKEQSINCPVHDDRHASCSLNLDKQVVYCHACGFGGGPLQIIMKNEGFTDLEQAERYAEDVLRVRVEGVRRPVRKEQRVAVSRLRERLFG